MSACNDPCPRETLVLIWWQTFEVWFSRQENTRERTGRRVESLTFRTVGRKRIFVQNFVDDVVQCHIRRQGEQSYLYTYNDGWTMC